MAEQKRFALYEYLVFFWKKKVFFLIIPLLFALLGFGASYVIPKDGKYVGSATVFTGSIKLKGLTNPSNVVATYGKDVHGVIDAYVSSESYVKIKIFDDNQERLEKDLEKMAAGIEKGLVDNFQLRYEITEDNIKNNETILDELSDVLKVSTDKLDNNELTIAQTSDVTSLLEWTEVEASKVKTSIQNMKSDLAFFEKPGIVSQDVGPTNTYKLELTLAGLVLGVIAAILILMLWNYINEARRHYKHD
ncbi:polyhydroxyalkanoate synthesis regulator protein [Cytobacillus eiseniae]|uniref:Polyhydroxyalkanoate synthesis regulator protein n=1 Tax=Cytobacillus eiseniae TaxID=762947 RepID=A0ABS4RJG2_9BACI|nr:hypothetical protein [Cytobacillus eiseniae]MBP2241952.1 polyhydroxyalkanoate synthesis regulator protein [Cytobacillus eiseniae]